MGCKIVPIVYALLKFDKWAVIPWRNRYWIIIILIGKLAKTDEEKKIELLFRFFSTKSTSDHKDSPQLKGINRDGNNTVPHGTNEAGK